VIIFAYLQKGGKGGGKKGRGKKRRGRRSVLFPNFPIKGRKAKRGEKKFWR